MKVLHFYRTYFPDTQGGAEEVIRQICAGTKALGVESRVLTLSENPFPCVVRRPEVDVYRAKLDLDIASCSMGVEAFSLFRELSEWADIIHYHFPWPFADVARFCAHKKPSLVTYHSDIVRQRWLGKLYKPLMHNFLRSMTAIVATSPNYVESSKVLKKYSKKISVIPIGLDEKLYPKVSTDLVRDIFKKYGDEYFLFVGVLREYKGLHILLEAMKGAPFSLLIAGKGPQEAALKRQADSLGLKNIYFLGYVSDDIKVALLSGCRGVVLPSHLRSEAFGVSLLEGAMMGKPLISTNVGTGTSFVNIDGETGLVVHPSDSSALRSAMDSFFEYSDRASGMGTNAFQRYRQYFLAETMAAKYLEVYGQILNCT